MVCCGRERNQDGCLEERRGGTFGKGEGKQGARNYDLSLINTLHKELHLKELLTDSFVN